MRKLALVSSFFILVTLLPLSALGTTTPDEHWNIPRATLDGQLGVGFDDRQGFSFVGALRALVMKNGVPTGPICKSLNDPACVGAEYFSLGATLSPCKESTQVNCVESLTARKQDGTTERATFVGYVSDDESLYWKGDEAKFIPDSKVESIWNFPSLTHPGGKDFLLNPILGGSYAPEQLPKWTHFVTMLQPVSRIIDSQMERPRAMGNERLDFMSPEAIAGKNPWTGGQRGSHAKNCATSVDGACYRREPFPEGVSFSVAIRTNSQVGGWIHGRMKSPEVSINQSGNAWVVTVGGLPTEIPVVSEWFDNENDKKTILSAYASAAPTTWGVGSSGTAQFYTNSTYDSTAINRLNVVRPYIKDKASANPKIWAFGSIDPVRLASDAAALGGKGYCVLKAPGLAGIVMTNATVYDGSIPAYSEKDQTLNYLVSAPHYAANGTEFVGTYDLVIRADIARCIYGFNKTPTSATVSIVRGDTVEKVSTTTLTEKDGWLSLAAYGFTFSTPKISVKLNRAPEEIPVTTAAVASATQESTNAAARTAVKPAPKKAVVKSIYCAKANARKLVKGNNPKCPKGYKLVK